MTRKTIRIFIDENYSRTPKKNYPTNKTDVYHIDDFWSLDISDLKDYGPEKNIGYGHILVKLLGRFLKLQQISLEKFLKFQKERKI